MYQIDNQTAKTRIPITINTVRAKKISISLSGNFITKKLKLQEL